tara:strand:+ start:3073 stop:3492 length:420 start_codon:yes stop_codon:yes gene_type:complete
MNAFMRNYFKVSLLDYNILVLYFIYNADGSFFGEISYFIKKLSGRNKCKLCDLSHNLIFQEKSWDDFLKELELPYRVLHINELPESIKMLNLNYPSILLEKDDSFSILISHNDFTNIDSIDDLRNALGKSLIHTPKNIA